MKLLLGLALGFGAAAANGAGADLPAFERELEDVLREGEGRALAGVVVVDGKVVWTRAFGVADLDSGAAATTKTLFPVASVSKILTGLGLCELAAAGRLSLDDDLARVAPELPFVNPFPGRPLLVRHLLEHTTGVQEQVPRWVDERRGAVPSVTELVRRSFREVPVRWPAGERSVYSNFNYIAAHHVIEKTTGMPFDTYITTRLLSPLGMTSTFRLYGEPKSDAAKGYVGRSPEPVVPPVGAYRVAAGLAASAEDLGRLIVMLLDDGKFEGREIVPRRVVECLEEIRTGPPGRHGLPLGHGSGVVAREMHGRKLHGHNGIVDGFAASLFYGREDRFGFALMTNAHPLPRAPSLSRARDAVFAHFAPGKPPPAPTTDFTPTPIESLTGFYLYASSRFALFSGVDRLTKSVRVEAKDGRLFERTLWGDPRELIETAPSLFRHQASRYPEVILTSAYLFRSPNGYYEKKGPAVFWIQAMAWALAALSLAAAPFLWLWAVCVRRERSWTVRFLGVALLSLAVTAGAAASLRTSEEALTLNPFTAAFCAGTVSFYLASLAAFAAGLRRRHFVRLVALTGLLTLAQLLLLDGWIGFKSWDGGASLLAPGG